MQVCQVCLGSIASTSSWSVCPTLHLGEFEWVIELLHTLISTDLVQISLLVPAKVT